MMTRTRWRWAATAVPLGAVLIWATTSAIGQSGLSAQAGQTVTSIGTAKGEWPTYGGNLASMRYSPADQINADNFNKLEVAWHFNTEALGPRPETQLQGTPLMVNGIIYATAGTRRAAVALDAATGEMIWMHSENEGKRGESAPRQLSGPRPVVLDRRQGRRSHPLRHARLSDGRAQREDRREGFDLRREGHDRSEAGRRSGDGSGHG